LRTIHVHNLLLTALLVATSNLMTHAQEPARPLGIHDSVLLPASSVPDWFRSGLIYEVYPRAFSAAGNLNGVTAGLDRLKALGVTVVWLMPIHPVGQLKRLGTDGSPYAVKDYYAIAPDYGTKEDLRHLVDESHRRGMRVIMDMVADHTAFDSVMMKHPDFYQHDKSGQLVSPHGWHDVAGLDYTNPALRRYMLDVMVYWVKNFGVDGYRCDAAGLVPTNFWEEARTDLDRIRPDILMLAEASKPELMQKAFDIDYAWPLLFKLDDVIEHGAPATELRTTLDQQRAIFPKGALHMMISDDHDEQRALVRYGASGALAASALMFTLDGVPLLYNGMEAGDATPSSGPALFDSLKIYWQSEQLRPEFERFYSFMIPFRKGHPALWRGALRWIHNSDEQHVLSYERLSPDDNVLVVINLSNTPFHGTVETAGNSWREIGDSAPPNETAALSDLSLGPFEFRIFESKSGF
jgi:cyclomaltodextrinase / maltogenic alpha-amylase / neopullulanase